MKASGLKGFRLSGLPGMRALGFTDFPVFVSWEQRAPDPLPRNKSKELRHSIMFHGSRVPQVHWPRSNCQDTQFPLPWEQSLQAAFARSEIPRNRQSVLSWGRRPPDDLAPKPQRKRQAQNVFLFGASCRSPSSHWTEAGEAQTVSSCFNAFEQPRYPENQQHAP